MDLGILFKMENETGHLGPDFFRKKAALGVLYLIVMCTAAFSGTVGNILVIAAVLISKHLRNVGNGFIMNLAVADLCVTACVDPFSIVGLLKGKEWFDDKPIICDVVASVCLTSCFCSLLNIGCISFNRYIHICHNVVYLKIYTLRNSVIMCISLWVVCFLIQTPNYYGWGDYNYDTKSLMCIMDRTADLSYTIFFSTAGVACPVLLIAICYLKIYLHVRSSKNKVAPVARGGGAGTILKASENRESMRLARTLFIIFLVFAACWTPYAVTAALDYRDVYPQAVHLLAIMIAHVNSSLNCIVYGLTNKHFRRSYYRILRVDWFLRKLGCARFTRGHVGSGSGSTGTAPPGESVSRGAGTVQTSALP